MTPQEEKIKAFNSVNNACVENNCVLLYATIVGSVAYGNNTASSDLDVRFVFAGNPSLYLGFGGKDSLTVGSEDIFGYEVRKWVQLLLGNNPTVLEMLFMEEDSMLYMHPAIKQIFDHKQSFLSKNCFNSYMKYAEGQIYKAKSCTKEVVDLLESYEKVLQLNGVDLQNLSVKQVVRDKLVEYPDDYTLNDCLGVTIGNVIDNFKKFKQKKFPYSDLGAKRRNLLKLYGFDTKNCSHAIRLGRTCKDIFQKKELRVKRSDAQHFMDIKNGMYDLNFLETEFLKVKEEVEALATTSDLPEEPDREEVEKLCIEVLKEVLFADTTV